MPLKKIIESSKTQKIWMYDTNKSQRDLELYRL